MSCVIPSAKRYCATQQGMCQTERDLAPRYHLAIHERPAVSGAAYKVVSAPANQRMMFSPAASYVPGTGTWQIGNYAAGNSGNVTLDCNDWNSIWTMVTNE